MAVQRGRTGESFGAPSWLEDGAVITKDSVGVGIDTAMWALFPITIIILYILLQVSIGSWDFATAILGYSVSDMRCVFI